MKKFLTEFFSFVCLFCFFSCSIMVDDFTNLSKTTDFTVECYADGIASDSVDYFNQIAPSVTVKDGNPNNYEPQEIAGFNYITKEVTRITTNFYRVRFIYSRKQCTAKFDISNAPAEAKWTDTQDNNIKILYGKFGAALISPTVQDISFGESIFFKGWNQEIPETFGLSDIIYTAKWLEKSSTQAFYEIRYYFEEFSPDGLSSEEKLDETKTIVEVGTIGTAITLSEVPASVTGYLAAVVTNIAQLNANVSGQPYQYVKVYYERASVTYTFDTDGGTWEDNTTASKNCSGKIGSKVPAILSVEKEDYAFLDWNPLVPATFGDSDKTFTAQWKSPASGNSIIQNPYNADAELILTQRAKQERFDAVCTPPYSSSWTYKWEVNGVQNNVTTNSFTTDDLDVGVYVVKVYLTDGTNSYLKTARIQIVSRKTEANK